MKTITLKITGNFSKALIALLFCGTVLSSCGPQKVKEKDSKDEEGKQQAEIDTPAVETVLLQKGKLTSSIKVPGELAPYQQVDLYAKSSSYVKQLLVDVGSQVHKGQVLITLDAPEIKSQLAEANARIAQQKAIYLSSKSTYDRLISTSKTPGTIAQNDIDQAAAKKDGDMANIEAAKSFYKQVSANLEYLQIRAPFDGVVSARNVNVGAYVGPSGKGSDQPLLVLQQQNRLRLVVSIPEMYTAGLTDHNEVEFSVRSMPNQKFKAKVTRLAGALDSKLRAERLEMDVFNNDKKLLPGMYAEVNVTLPARDSNYVVPRSAVVTSTEKVFVIKIDDKHHAQWINIKRGLQTDENIEIFGAQLSTGDKIVLKATDEIRAGTPVRDKAAAPKEPKKAAE